MAQLLLTWLNEEVKLSRPIARPEADFASGFLLGELLFRYGALDDLGGFFNSESNDHRVQNFKRLQPALHVLGVKLDGKTASAIMTAQPGIVQQLLFQIRMAVDSAASAPTRALGNTMRATRVTKPQFDTAMAQQFNQQLRLNAAPADGGMARTLRKFEQAQQRQEAAAQRARQREQELRMLERQQAIQQQRQQHREAREFMREWDEAGKVDHQKNAQRQLTLKKDDLRFELTVREQKQRAQAAGNARARSELLEGLDEFEKTLQRVAVSSSSTEQAPGVGQRADDGEDDADGASGSGASRGVPVPASVATLHRLQKKLPTQAEREAQASEFLGTLHGKTAAEEEARKERERRRRRALVNQQSAVDRAAERREEEHLLEVLLRQSRDEMAIAKAFAEQRAIKEQIVRRRIIRNQLYAEQRERDFADAIQRRAEVERRVRAEYEEETRVERERRAELRAQERAAKTAANTEYCAWVAGQLVDLASKAAAFRDAQGGGLIPDSVMREWVALFVAGTEQYPVQQPLSGAERETERQLAIMDDCDLEDFAEGAGEWAPAYGARSVVPDVLHRLRLRVHPPPPPPPRPDILKAPLAVCVVGAPYSGKTSLALALCRKRHLCYLSVDDCLRRAVHAHEAKQVSELAEMGRAIQATLDAGQSVDTDTIVRAIVNAVNHGAVRLDTVEHSGGWLLDGFPRTLTEARALEKALSGFEDPAANVAPPKKGAKPVEPPPALPEAERPRSGFDVVIWVDAPVESAERRAIGRRIDGLHNAVYHVEFAPPPPTTDAALLERLQAPVDTAHVLLQLQQQSTAYDAGRADLAAFFSRLRPEPRTLHNTDGALERAVDELVALAESASDAKRAEQDAAAAEAAKRAAADVEAAAAAAAASEAQDGAGAVSEEERAARAHAEAEAKRKADEVAAAQLSGARLLLEKMDAAEARFVSGAREVFGQLRQLRYDVLQYFVDRRQEFSVHLNAPDVRASLLADFVSRFNGEEFMPHDLRKTDEGRAELHLRVDELRDKLWAACDALKEELGKQRTAVSADPMLAESGARAARLGAALVQLLVDRLVLARVWLDDAACSELGSAFNTLAVLEHAVVTDGAPAPAASADAYMAAVAQKALAVVGDGPNADAVAAASAAAAADAATLLERAAARKLPWLQAEVAATRERIERVQAFVTSFVQRLRERHRELLDRLEESAVLRFRSDVDGVRAAAAHLRTVIEDQEGLLRDELLARPSDRQVLLDRSVRMLRATPTPAPIEPMEPFYEDAFTVEQLRTVWRALCSAGTDGFVTLSAFVSTLARLAASAAEQRTMPMRWACLTIAQFGAVARALDVGTGHVDARRFVVELALPRAVPQAALSAYRAALAAAGGGNVGTPLSFDEFTRVRWWLDDAADGSGSVASASPSEAPFDRSFALKALLYDVFAARGPGVDGTGVHPLQVLLYLCTADDASEGLQRAFALAGGSLSPEVAFDVLHTGMPRPGGPLPYADSDDPAALAVLHRVYGSAPQLTLTEIAMSIDAPRILSTTLFARRVALPL